MKRQKTARLSAKSFDDLARWVQEQKDELNRRMEILISRLADLGIATAELHNYSEYDEYIKFSKRMDGTGGMLVVAAKTQDVISRWVGGPPDGVAVNPLLMVEFGSGNAARDDAWTVKTGTGQGTFPGQTHAFEPVWYYQPIEDDGTVGEWQSSSGFRPGKPLYWAFIEMTNEINTVAREVFS